jgi:hypothetical protein
VDLLRRVLYVMALQSVVGGLALVVAPRLLLVSLLGQPEYPDYAWVRLLGMAALSLSLLAVLVAQRIEDLWWWSWAFVILIGGQAIVSTLHAAFGLPPTASAWPWWALAGLWWLIAAGILLGLARAGAESGPA